MANYPKIITTYKGLALISETVASSKALVFTKIVLGDGDIKDQDFRALTDLLSLKMTLPVTGGADIGNGQVQIRAAVSNSALETGFFAKEVGVYAKSGNDGSEILLAYTNGGNYVDYIPDKSTPIDSLVFKVDVVVGNASNVKIQVKDETFITKAELDDHNSDPDAHQFVKNTIVDTLVPRSDSDTIRNQLSQIANRIKEISGNNGWKDAPLTTLSTMAAFLTNMETAGDVEWSGKKFTNRKMGVSGLIDQNGYIAFGKNFGGLIIQWIISAKEDTLIKVPLSGCRKVYETAIHKTTADNIVPLSMRDSGNDNVYIVSKQGTDYSAYWMGLFILNN